MSSSRILWIETEGGELSLRDNKASLSGLNVDRASDLSGVSALFQPRGTACIVVAGEVAGCDPVHLLELLHNLAPAVPVVFRRSDMTSAEAARLVRAGAYHCFDSRDSLDGLREVLDRAIQEKRQREKARQRAASSIEKWHSLLIGDGTAMQSVLEAIRLVGPRRCTVLITGETGTGKELVARALHMSSPRAQARMVAINCSALPEHLLEAELFGHTKGAFTGAVALRVGRFEEAHESTLFLDEIGDMPLDLQAKLLRVLQDQEVQRLGSSESIKVDVRIIAASNVDLLERVRQGRFRADLYYRLNVVPIQTPPLRRRVSDIPTLVSHFLGKICSAEHIPLKRLSAEALERLCGKSWPGNVRQLENAIEQAIVLSGDREILYPRDFGLAEGIANPLTPALDASAAALLSATFLAGPIDFVRAVGRFELTLLENALRRSNGNKTLAAEYLGIKRTTLIMKLRSLRNAGAGGEKTRPAQAEVGSTEVGSNWTELSVRYTAA